MKNFNLFSNKHFRFVAVLCLLLSLCSSKAWGALSSPSSCTFSAAGGSKTLSDDNSDVTWTASAAPSSFEGTGTARGLQWTGATVNATGGLTLTCSSYAGLTITQIAVVWSRNNSAGATVSAKVGDASFGSADTNTATTSKRTATFTGSASGTITINATSTASKNSFYIKSITVTYTTGSTKTLVYDANGGSGEMANTTGATVNAATCTFTPPTCMVFDHWNTEVNNNGISYNAGESVPSSTTLYAIWVNNPSDPTQTFSNGSYTTGGSALDLSTLFSSNSSGAVTYSVTNDGGTGASIAGTSFSATTAGSCTVQASQAADAPCYNAKTATATITVSAPTLATITLNNYSGSATTTGYHSGESFTLPSTNDFTCGELTFVGWSSVEIANSATKPSVATYHEPGESVTLGASNTFYAVFAEASGGGAATYTKVTTISAGTYLMAIENATQYTPTSKLAYTGDDGSGKRGGVIGVSISDGVISSKPAEAKEITVTLGTGDDAEYFAMHDGSKYLTQGDKNAFSFVDEVSYQWNLNASGQIHQKGTFDNSDDNRIYVDHGNSGSQTNLFKPMKVRTEGNNSGSYFYHAYLFKKSSTISYSNYTTNCGCSDWGFYYGTDGQSDWTFECFSQVDDTHEWRTGVFSIPNKPNWYVDNAAENDARKVLTTWSTLYFAASQGDGVRPMVGAAVGATGKVRIYDDNGWNNRYAGFIPDGYKLKFGTDYSPFTLSAGNTYYSDVVTYNSSTANRTVAVGVINANSSNAYVSTDNTQEMRHIFLNTGGEDLWSKNNTPYFGLYDITNTRFTCLMVAVPGQDYLYEGWVPSNCTQVMFVRLKSSTLEFGSMDSNVHNKTGNLSLQSDKSLFTITDWGAGTWSAYERSGKFRIDVNYTDKNWYARFYPQYVLHYDANGGSGAPADQSIAADASPCQLTVSTTEPTQAGYTFLGWNPTKASADAGTKDDDWDRGDTHAMTGDVTLYAVWAANHTLSYNYNGGDGSSCVGGTYYTGQSFTACSSAGDKTGYTFTGWLGSNSTNYTAGTTYAMPNSDLTLTAQWSATDYVVTMAQSPAAGATLNGGTTTAHYGGTINISTNVPSGYVFNGWTSSPSVTFADASATSTSFTMPASNVTITANFTPTHTATFVGPDGSTLQTVTVAEGAAVAYSESTPVSCDEEANPSSTFVGWATDTWTGKKAAKGNIPVGTTFYDIVGGGESLPNMGNGDVTYYAVFAKATGDPLVEKTWSKTMTAQTYNSDQTKTLSGTETITGGASTSVDASWTTSTYNNGFSSATYGSYDSDRGTKVGTSTEGECPYTMELSSYSFSGTITHVKISTSGNSGVSGTVSVYVNSTAFSCAAGNSLTKNNTEYDFTGSKTIDGNKIQIYWEQDFDHPKALYFKKIEVVYTTGGDISYSNYMTTCSTCTTPSGVTANNITKASADISWSGVSSSGTTGFTIQWGTDGTRTNNDNTANTDANTKTKSLTGLEAETTYYVWVSSRCDGTWSDRASFTTLAVHDITFNKDNGTLSVVSPVGVVDGETLTFPNVTSTSCGTFVGWKVTEVSDYDNVAAPSPLYKHNDTKENITADESYQAVYRTATGAETDVTDNWTGTKIGVSIYSDWTGRTDATAAVYAGNTTKNSTYSNCIQMKNSDACGIVTTTSGGLAKKVTITWNSNTTNDKAIDIYGKNTPYSSSSDLYNNENKGTKLGSITKGSTTELTITGDYAYIGIRCSDDGARYIDNIAIQWYGTPMHYMTAPTCDATVGITASFSAFTYVYGSGPSAAQSFMVSGINLSEALVVTAPTNYEVCKTADGTYTSSVSFTPAAGKVSAETVYIRLAAGLNVGTYNYDAANGVSVASNSATPQTAALNGSVTKAAGAIAFTDFNAVDHYEAELEKGMSDIDVPLTVSVTGDGSVSYSKSPAAGVSPTIPATQPTTTLHVLQPGIWTVTATLTAGTNYTGANTNCEVRVKRVDTYVDFIHNKTIKEYSSDATIVDGKMSDWGSGYTVPYIDDNAEETSGSCQQTHYKFMGWVSEDDINIADGTFKTGWTLIQAGTESKLATTKTYYAVWAKLEE